MEPESPIELTRRSWLKWGTTLLGGLWAAILGVPAVGYLIDPRNRPAAAGSFKTVAMFGDLEENVPTAAVIRDIRRDAWTLHPDDVLGRVWLIWRGEKAEDGTPKVEAYTTICPHLGGSINFEEKSQCFVCPLHGATFKLNCQRVSDYELGRSNPAPRDMDSLEVELEAVPESDGEFYIKVKYENFIQGHETKKKKA
jgi:menaquinol-cytochrome c reductase iron-sulfur subunit